jgi:hypothetical protein
MLPGDLRTAEAQAREALVAALAADGAARWTLEWRFEGLRLLPPALRLLASLSERSAAGTPQPRLLFADAGATALAQREGPAMADRIASFADQLRLQESNPSDGLLLACSPSQAEYAGFEQLCRRHRGAVVMLNGSLVDAAVGIGSVARERRRGFLAVWRSAYALVPLAGAALRHAYPGAWELYRQRPDGRYVQAATFEHRPDAEEQAQALGTATGLAGVDAFLEGLRR